ncbi:putative protein OS=Streptomyces lavendulae subsp. lavendulae OX=58340 GN=SLAV_00540 PE=4 SV=1 [Streptomyces lavendulae subsp. lavendulae]
MPPSMSQSGAGGGGRRASSRARRCSSSAVHPRVRSRSRSCTFSRNWSSSRRAADRSDTCSSLSLQPSLQPTEPTRRRPRQPRRSGGRLRAPHGGTAALPLHPGRPRVRIGQARPAHELDGIVGPEDRLGALWWCFASSIGCRPAVAAPGCARNHVYRGSYSGGMTVTISDDGKRVAMPDVTENKDACPFCKRYPERGGLSGLAEHLQKDCTSLTRDSEDNSPPVLFGGCALIAVALAPGGGGFGVYVFVGQDADGNCLYAYAGSPPG